MRRLADEAEIGTADTILEVGAGTGGLTDLLVARAGRVVAVELDRDLFPLLQDRFAESTNVTLIHTDVLERKHRIAPEVVATLFGEAGASLTPVKLVSNLPYHVATPLLMNLLLDFSQVQRFVFSVQAEVGERLSASPGTSAYGPLAIVSQLLAQVTKLCRLPPHVFWPQPAVDSVMMRIDLVELPFANRDEPHRFASFVRHVFEHRRKTLRSALRYVVTDECRDQICARFDAERRPETFSIPEWRAMHEIALPYEERTTL